MEDSNLNWTKQSPSREGNGNPLQYSCLENPIDRQTWWATVQGVAKELDMTEQLKSKNNKKKSKSIAVFPSLASFSEYFMLLFTKYFWVLHFKKWVEGIQGASALSDSLFSETLKRTVRGMYLYAHEWYSAVCSLLGLSCLFKNPHKENYWYLDINNRMVWFHYFVNWFFLLLLWEQKCWLYSFHFMEFTDAFLVA